jgi:hypothetical protein
MAKTAALLALLVVGCRSDQQVTPWPRADWDRCAIPADSYWQPTPGDPGTYAGSSLATVRDGEGNLLVATLAGRPTALPDYLDPEDATAPAEQVATWWSDPSGRATLGSHVNEGDTCCYDPMVWAAAPSDVGESGSGAIAGTTEGDEALPLTVFEPGTGPTHAVRVALLRVFGMTNRWVVGTRAGNDDDLVVYDLDGTPVNILENRGLPTWEPAPQHYHSAVGDLDGDGPTSR